MLGQWPFAQELDTAWLQLPSRGKNLGQMAVLFFLHRQNLQMEQEGLSGEKQLCDNPKRVDACPWDCRRRTAAGRYQWGTHTYFGEQKSPIQRQVVKETVPRDLHSSDSVIWGLTLSPRREPPSQSAPALHHSSPRPRQGPQLLRQSSGARLFPAKSLPGRAGCRAGVGAGSLGGAEPPAPAPGWTRGGGGGREGCRGRPALPGRAGEVSSFRRRGRTWARLPSVCGSELSPLLRARQSEGARPAPPACGAGPGALRGRAGCEGPRQGRPPFRAAAGAGREAGEQRGPWRRAGAGCGERPPLRSPARRRWRPPPF